MKKIFLFLVGVFFVSALSLYVVSLPPKDTVYPTQITYNTNESVGVFIQKLHDAGIIKNQQFFKVLLVFGGYDTKIKPNVYVFEQPLSLFSVARKIGTDSRLAKGVKVVIPEGSTNAEIAFFVSQAFPKMSVENIKKAQEGYFFPDTYFFSINSTEEDIIKILKSTFTQKTKTVFEGKTEQEIKNIIILASLLEKEGRTEEERRVIAGILLKRLSIGMPLQVDATFLYTQNKGSSELTLSDLETDNPYNTYTRKGLPIGPINNPGLETIESALNPEPSPYFYYLHDENGGIHYGKTFEEHKKNKAKYLK